MSFEKFLRAVHADSAISWRTTAPYDLGNVEICRIGFAGDPVVLVQVRCRADDVSSLVPIVRQYVFFELQTAGVSNEAVMFVPSVSLVDRKRKFVDRNESSPTKGKNKMGNVNDYKFRIESAYLDHFVWETYRLGRLRQVGDL